MNNTKCKQIRQRIEIKLEIAGTIYQVRFVERNQNSLTDNSSEKILRNARRYLYGQVKKSIRRMPWHWEPTKDVISCEKLR